MSKPPQPAQPDPGPAFAQDGPGVGAPAVRVTRNGPYEVSGGVPLTRRTIVPDDAGASAEWREDGTLEPEGDPYYLCRCGHSGNKPFCDGSHERVGFDGTETAPDIPYLDQAQEEDGPELTLTDAPRFCAFARFCDAGDSVWRLALQSGAGAAEARRQAADCPSGRLVTWNLAERRPEEPRLAPSVGVVDDPQQGVGGPLWIRGAIPVSGADGRTYEVRNRVTLCRCGQSRNKPFCDGTHAAAGFTG